VLIIEGVNVVDVKNLRIQQGRNVLIEEGYISHISSSDQDRFSEHETIDGADKYLIPGLWDMHTHVVRRDYIQPFNKLMVANGVLGFREMWCDEDVALDTKTKMEEGSLIPQKFIYANHILDGDPPIWEGSISVTTPGEAVDAVNSLAETKTDFIKVYTNLSAECFFAIGKRCQALGLDIVGHIPKSVKALDAVAKGHMRSIEHMYGMVEALSPLHDSLLAKGDIGREEQIAMLFDQDDELGERLYREMIKNDCWQVPTFAMWRGQTKLVSPYSTKEDERVKYMPHGKTKQWNAEDNRFVQKLDEEMFQTWQRLMDRHQEIVGEMFEEGVGIMAGTDAATANPYTFPGFSLHDELSFLVECGLSNGEALQAATIKPAEFMDVTEALGLVKEGRKADLIVLDKNPLDDIRHTTSIETVIVKGEVLRRPELDSILLSVEEHFNREK